MRTKRSANRLFDTCTCVDVELSCTCTLRSCGKILPARVSVRRATTLPGAGWRAPDKADVYDGVALGCVRVCKACGLYRWQ